MLSTYTWPRYEYRRAPELDAGEPRRVPLVIVGAGPVGLSAAIDAALRGQAVIVLDDDNTVSVGSRGVCYAKRTLEIFDRLGLGDRVVAKGVTWNVGRTFHGEREVFSFNLLPESGHQRPGMVNLQQYHLEQYLVERAMELPLIDLRWQHKLVQVTPGPEGVQLEVDTADGRYTLHADWLIAADGTRSTVRRQMGLDVEGRVFQDRFLIADIVLHGEPFPLAQTERRFWFAPSFHAGESALMHRQADDVWRIDFQLGWDADPQASEREKEPERVRARVRAALDSQGFAGLGFELEWVSVYTFQCRRMAKFRHGRVLFVGDSAHQVSPFGARGANSGIQDADNLVWKLKRVIDGTAPETLLDSYDQERGAAADENLLNSSRSTDFMTPKTRVARVLRNAVLSLADELPAGRALVNSGRLSVPTRLSDSPLNTPDSEAFEGWMTPGAPLDDAPLQGADGPRWLLDVVSDADPAAFVLLHFGRADAATRSGADAMGLVLVTLLDATETDAAPSVRDSEGLAASRYDARPGTCYLVRPDQHVAARWRRFDAAAVRAAMWRATGRTH